ncbi:MAG: alanine dehydrogenase, partial [Acidimicrobiales bacterium]
MTLVVGVPTEIKEDEARIAITPDGVRELNAYGIDVLVQSGAGAGSSLDDDTFRRAGAEIVAEAPELWERAELIC